MKIDVIAFLEIFKQYESNNRFYDKLCKAVEKWEEIEQNNLAKNIELKPNQEKQKEADYNSKQDVFELLDMTRKIVLTESVIDIAKFKTKQWKEKINQFYTYQFGLHQITKHSNILNVYTDNGDDDDDTKEGLMSDVFNEKDLNSLKKIQLLKDENKTLILQNKQLRKQIKVLTKEADSLRNENIHLSSNSAKQLQNIAIIKKQENNNINNNNNQQNLNHQYDKFPTLMQIVEKYEWIKNNYLTKPAKCIIKDMKKVYIDHSDQFITKMIHEIMFEILFISFNKMKECQVEFYINASKLFFIQDMEILRDLCRGNLQKTYLNIYNEHKDNYCNDILDIIISSYSRYSFSNETKTTLIQFINECLKICWQLILCQNGDSLLFKPKTFDFEPKSKQIMYNPEIYDAAFGSHLKESLNYVSWPAIYDKISNEPLSKICAMFSSIIPKFSQQFVNKKLTKMQQEQYDTIRIITEPEGASDFKSNESSIIKNILSKQQETDLYKVYVGISFGYNELSAGYIDNHNKKKFNTIFKKYPTLLLNLQNELEAIGQSAFNEIDENEIKSNYYAFNNFMISLADNKMVEIENKYDGDNDNIDDIKKNELIELKDNNGKTVDVALLFDVTLHFFWNSILDVIKKSYLDKFNETIKETEIEWKISIPDNIYNFCKPLLKQSGSKLGLCDNLILIKESQAIATNYNIKLMNKNNNNQNTKFMSIMLNKYCLMIGCYKIMNEYKTKELIKPKSNKNVSLNRITDRFISLLTDCFDDGEFDKIVENKPNKINQIKLNFLKTIKSDKNGLNDNIFNNIFGTMLDSMYKEIDKLLKIKQIEGCKQHIIICGELSEIECIQNKIREKYKKDNKNNNNINKIKEENIHFAKSKLAKGTSLFDLVSPKNNLLTYRANKSWGISVQRDYIEGKDDKNKRVFNDINKAWNVNGVFYEIIKKGQSVIANHCQIIWVQPIHKKKIQIDVYSSTEYIGGDDNILYVDECEYEGSQSFELLKEWKNKNEIPVVFWCEVEENNKIRLHVSINNISDASSRVIDLRWTVKSK